MKRILSYALAGALALPVVGAVSVSLAQRAGGDGPGCEHGRGDGEHGGRHGHRGAHMRQRFEQMADRLQLTPAQRTQAMSIFREERERMHNARHNRPEGERPSRDEMHAAFEASRQAVQARIAAILTPAQRPIFEQIKAEIDREIQEHRERRQQRDEAARGI